MLEVPVSVLDHPRAVSVSEPRRIPTPPVFATSTQRLLLPRTTGRTFRRRRATSSGRFLFPAECSFSVAAAVAAEDAGATAPPSRRRRTARAAAAPPAAVLAVVSQRCPTGRAQVENLRGCLSCCGGHGVYVFACGDRGEKTEGGEGIDTMRSERVPLGAVFRIFGGTHQPLERCSTARGMGGRSGYWLVEDNFLLALRELHTNNAGLPLQSPQVWHRCISVHKHRSSHFGLFVCAQTTVSTEKSVKFSSFLFSWLSQSLKYHVAKSCGSLAPKAGEQNFDTENIRRTQTQGERGRLSAPHCVNYPMTTTAERAVRMLHIAMR